MREKILFDDGWLFHRGDIKPQFPETKGTAYTCAKTERMHMGPAAVGYYAAPDSYDNSLEHRSELWQSVTLPHDYIIDAEPQEHGNSALGFFPYDNAWYRKTFTLPKEDEGRRLTLYFEGIATHATVYLNGCLMKHNFCGYSPFEVDISDVAVYGGENVLAVYVNTEEHESWWYEGGGIYRHVWLGKTDATCIDLYGIYVLPERIEGEDWKITVENTVRNDRTAPRAIRAVTTITDRESGDVLAVLTAEGQIEDYACATLTASTNVSAPHLWSPDDPHLYIATTELFDAADADAPIDVDRVRFGFRYLRADPDHGLFLNGKHVLLQGVCGHADCGLMGKAVPDNIHREKVHMMKEMGANGYRCSHYPQAEVLMDAFDELGMLVMDEVRWFESTDEGLEQLTILLKRDRNRPSVIFWSLGNEEPLFITDQGRRIARRMVATARKLIHRSGFLLLANDRSPDQAKVYDACDLIGINYHPEIFDSVHAQRPDQAIFSSENCATGTTRGWYRPTSPKNAYCSAYDADTNSGFRAREYMWKFFGEREWVIGGFQWIAFEHRGEAMWPRLCSQSGAIDLYLQKKDAFYQNQSLWTSAPMVHLLPHWTFPGREGEVMDVWAYTNCDAVELFLNGASIGGRTLGRFDHAEWKVPYTPGTLEVRAYRDGVCVAVDRKETAGRGERLALRLENREPLCAGGRDMAIVTCLVLDAAGREVPDAAPFVRFSTDGGGTVFSTGSDICDHTKLHLPDRRMRAGRITVAVRTGDAARIRLYAESDGLASAALDIPVCTD